MGVGYADESLAENYSLYRSGRCTEALRLTDCSQFGAGFGRGGAMMKMGLYAQSPRMRADALVHLEAMEHTHSNGRDPLPRVGRQYPPAPAQNPVVLFFSHRLFFIPLPQSALNLNCTLSWVSQAPCSCDVEVRQ